MEVTLLVWIYCNLLKSHKTTKTFFGNPWRWNDTSLEKLGITTPSNLEALKSGHEAAGRRTTAPHSTRQSVEGRLLPQ